MADRRPFTVVEIDLPTCANTYGTAPCTAAIGVTGTVKCYNTLRTCQDRANFTPETTTLRICQATENVPYDAVPCLQSVNVTPGVIDPGNSIGQRGKVKVAAADFPTGDALLDRYLGDRAYNPFAQGTFWPKLRARIPSLQGAALRVMRGEFGEDLSTFRVEHYFVESMLIDADGVDIVAKDALSFCDPKKAQCPVLSNGRLAADVSAVALSFVLTPSGIGDLEYPTAGVGCLAGKEIVTYTRAGNTVTFTQRSLYGTSAAAHEADSTFQQVAVFDSMSAADIVYSLLVDYTPGVDASWCDLPAWQADADNYIGHLYTAIVPAPTAVKTLLDEMMQQAGCSLWWDPVLQKIQFQTLRPVTTSAVLLTPDRIVESSFKAKEQPDKRLSEHWCYYGLSDATNKVDKENNFKAAVAKLDANSGTDYGDPAYGQVLARWIDIDNRPAAERLNAMKLARFRDPPRRASLTLFPTSPYLPMMGDGIQVQDFSLQEADGSPATVPFYVVSAESSEDAYHLEVEEFLFDEDAVPDNTRAVFIDVDHFNVNLRDLYDGLYSSVPTGATINFYVSPGAYVGGVVLGSPSMTVGTWPADTVLNLYVGTLANPDAAVLGRGGDGGGYPDPDGPSGEAGSVALYTRRPINLYLYGRIGGGGGGGQGRVGYFVGNYGNTNEIGDINTGFTFMAAGGGGGAGFSGYAQLSTARRGGLGGNGSSGSPASDGGTVTGGDGGTIPPGPGGDGGNLGEGGHYTDGAANHTLAGAAIDGISFVTIIVNTGAIDGAQVN